MSNIIIAHTDVDGVCAAAIAARYLNFNYKLIFSGPRGFLETLKRVRGNGCEQMIIVDIALNEEAVDEIVEEIKRIKSEGCKRILWIDHHAWSEDGLRKVAGEVEIKLERTPSAARLVQQALMPGDEISTRIAEIGDDADTNTNALPNTLAYKVAVMDPRKRKGLVQAFASGNFEPEGIEEWRSMASEELEKIRQIAKGASFYKTRGGLNFAFVDMRGKRAIGSLVAKTLINEMGASFVFILYSDTAGVLYGNGSVDLLKIAREFAGGGHMSASGVNLRLTLLDRLALRLFGRAYKPKQARELIKRLITEF